MKRQVFKTANSIGHIEIGDDEELISNQEPESSSGGAMYPVGLEVTEKDEEEDKSPSGGPLYPAGIVIENK